MPLDTTIPASGTKPFGELFTNALRFARDHWKVIMLVSLPLAVLMALYLAGLSLLPMSAGLGGQPVIEPGSMASGTGMVVGFLFLCSSIVGAITNAAYWLLATEGGSDPKALLRKALPITLPLVGVQLWAGLRSFTWLIFVGVVLVPILGPFGLFLSLAGFVTAIMLMPRFIAAPYIYVREKKGILQSVDDSYTRTEGRWGKIMGNLILFALCMFLLGIIIMIPVGMAAKIAGSLVAPVSGLAGSAVTAFLLAELQALLSVVGIAFIAMLSATILRPSRS